MATLAQIRAKDKYRAKNYDQINITVKKGLRDHWKACAERQGLSLASYITQVMQAACGPLEDAEVSFGDMSERSG